MLFLLFSFYIFAECLSIFLCICSALIWVWNEDTTSYRHRVNLLFHILPINLTLILIFSSSCSSQLGINTDLENTDILRYIRLRWSWLWAIFKFCFDRFTGRPYLLKCASGDQDVLLLSPLGRQCFPYVGFLYYSCLKLKITAQNKTEWANTSSILFGFCQAHLKMS